MDTNKYTEKVRAMPYPDRPKKPISPPKGASPAEIRKYADEVEEYQKDFPLYLTNVRDYNAKVGEVNTEFKAELLAELALSGHRKADLLFAIAWRKGHDLGYSEVWSEACELVELIR